MPFFVSPSKLARYFYHNCERQLKAALGSAEQLLAWGVEIPEREENPVVGLLQDSGYDWEEQVVGVLLEGQVKIAAGESPLSERVFDPEETLRQLADLAEGEWLYQPTLVPGGAFNERYELDRDLVRFATCRPDLLKVSDGKIQVVDVKASDALKSSHRVQVAFYALLLEDALKEVDSTLTVDRELGFIWLYSEESPTSFQLGPTIAILEGFLRDEFPRILKTEYDHAFWHLTPRCEWCELFRQCQTQAKSQQNVSLIPFLTGGARRYLKEQAGVETLDQLTALLGRGDADEKLRGCGSLYGRARRLRNAVESLQSGHLKSHGGSSLRLPIHEDVRIILSAQKEPVSGRCYLAGFQREGGYGVYPTTFNTEIFVAQTPEECRRVRAEFLAALFEEMYKLHTYNSGRPWDEQKTLQLYAFDGYEVTLFEDMMFQHLHDPSTTRQAMQLMLYFQSETLAQAGVHPVQEVAHPLVNIVQLSRELVSLPQPVMVHIQRGAALLSNTGDESLPFDPKFHYELNNAMRAGPILRAWREQPARGLGRIHREMRKRLQATHRLIEGLRKSVSSRLFAWPRKFGFPNFGRFRHPELSKLEFVIRYESFMRATAVRESRSRPLIERLRTGTSLSMVKGSDNEWSVSSSLDNSKFDDGGGFFSFLLAPVGTSGERAQMSFDDFRYRSSFQINSSQLRLAKVKRTFVDEESGLVTALELETKPGDAQAPIPAGARYHLHPRFADFNSDKQVQHLKDADQEPGSLLVKLLIEPGNLDAPTPPLFADSISGLTQSQQKAWRQVCRSKLTLVWGPPGTGKTHFLANAIDQLRTATPPLRVVVTAFTHSAVEHLLEKLAQNHPERPVRKLQPLRKPSQYVQVIDGKAARHQAPGTVFGATVYGLSKAAKAGLPRADVLIVDEGSQMKWGELTLALMALKPEGRLVIAGDDLQLPPILAGRYPAMGNGLPGLEDSVFAYLRARDNPENPFTAQLTENWRMHQRLSDFAAQTLYGPAYLPATPTVAGRKLKVSTSDHWLSPLLDPDYPLVICVLEDVQAAQENLVEAQLVAELAVLLRRGVPQGLTDKSFWKDHLFVVSPHHLQIRAILKELHRQHDWSAAPFVDTVDKMQGQESETVIVSYGVSDRETALREATFIYSLNRLNVSITRAQAKCIVFLPRPLLQPSFEVLDDDKAVLGLGHMNALLGYCQTHGQRLELNGGPKMSVWRA